LKDHLTSCELCPRRCRVNRRAGQTGYCKAGAELQVYRYGPHHGEEPPVSGTRGSGTVFFSRCTLRCLYCQNYPWSQDGAGELTTTLRLADAFQTLKAAGCHNLNLVSPTPWLPMITDALRAAHAGTDALPVVYNTSGYERIETLAELEGTVQVYLTDLRYSRVESAREGSGAPDYVAVARHALREMWRQVGALRTDESGVARSGTICRLLILPGGADEAVENLRWLAETVGTDVAVSVMSQYVPLHRAAAGPAPWNRPISREEHEQVGRVVEEIGFAQGWMQEFGEQAPPELLGHDMPPGGIRTTS
jgi:putative pyruvate formate lyase activating enzyme